MPENQRVTAEQKLNQLILLEESISTLRMDFNDRFLALRDLKRRLIDNITRDNGRIIEINKQLKVHGSTCQTIQSLLGWDGGKGKVPDHGVYSRVYPTTVLPMVVVSEMIGKRVTEKGEEKA